MNPVITFVGYWGHLLAAALAAAVALWSNRSRPASALGRLMVASLVITSCWALATALFGRDSLPLAMLESARNGVWIVAMYVAALRADIDPIDSQMEPLDRGIGFIFAVLIALLLGQTLIDLATYSHVAGSAKLVSAALLTRFIWAAGALLMVSHVSLAFTPSQRTRLLPIAAILSALWGYDLLSYAAAWIDQDMASALLGLRGLLISAAIPLFAVALQLRGKMRFNPSHALATRSIMALVALAAALAILAAIASIDLIRSPLLRLTVTAGIFSSLVASIFIVPTARIRALLKVLIAKHLLQHRYDYRSQWMSFADTMGRRHGEASPDSGSLHLRAIKAMADITNSPAGILLLPNADGELEINSCWNWETGLEGATPLAPNLIKLLGERQWVVDVDSLRASAPDMLPAFIVDDPRAWALVPVIHFSELSGAVLLARPAYSRALDWEDFDMLRTAGRQVASYIAESEGQRALAEARRFEEFNRRFAFIMHDLKNLVSQLSLLSRNAERHADNPEFRADMVLTLKESVGRMNDMLARLSQRAGGISARREPVSLTSAAEAVARRKGGLHTIRIEGETGIDCIGDPQHVEQILRHLVQNATEASQPGGEIVLRLARRDDRASIAVIDKGCGMTADFIASELFRPFASSKQSGFGIGVYESRELARAMGGELTVSSRPGEGSTFTVSLPLMTETPDFQARKDCAA